MREVQGRYLTPAYACLFLAIGLASRPAARRHWRFVAIGLLLAVYALTGLYAADTYGALPLP